MKNQKFLISTMIGLIVSFGCETEDEEALLPIVNTSEVIDISYTAAICGGNIVSDEGSPVTARGVCWDTIVNPTINLSTKTTDGSSDGTYISSMDGLIANTTYYVRAYATNGAGTAYGNEISFTTYNNNAISDIDNNYYNIVTIGTQIWMKENLKTTKYKDGSDISNINSNSEWIIQSTGAYCWYNNNIDNKSTYGALYNYYTVVDSRDICPTGWHIPSNEEWNILETYLGGGGFAGGKLKEAGTEYWLSPNIGADNGSGFTALPNGYRYSSDGSFDKIGKYGFWWSSTEAYGEGRGRGLGYTDTGVFKDTYDKHYGFSVRCIKD